MKLDKVPDRFRKRITVDENGCWLWTGAKFKSGGYGAIRVCGKTLRFHVFIFEIFLGPVPEGMQLHHKCEVPHCCNPKHLEILNQLDHSAAHLSGYCRRGHDLSKPENVAFHKGRRRWCKECRRIRNREYQQKKGGSSIGLR